MWRHYVYIHYRLDSEEPFYVGKGSHRKRDKKSTFERAYARHGRNTAWRSVADAHGFRVEVIAMCITDEAAQQIEMCLIEEIGRRDLRRGPLVNVTDGGEGHAGIIASEELRRKRSKNASAPRSEAWVQSIRVARKNGGNGGVVKHGDKLPAQWRRNLAAGKLGAKNPWFGRPSPVSKRVMNTETGRVYESIARAAEAEGIELGRLYSCLGGHRRNTTVLVRI